VFLCNYRGGSVFYTQYKSAIWWHDEGQRRKAKALQRRVWFAWLVMMMVVGGVCAYVVLTLTSEARYWSLLALPVWTTLVFPGQLHVLPSCPWHDAELYHQKYLAKERRTSERRTSDA